MKRRLRKNCILRLLLFVVLFSVAHASAAEESSGVPQDPPPSASEGYLINFNNVSMGEFVRFVARITNLNFIFEEGDLQFPVTIVSEEPIASKNVMTILVQVLRAHGIALLEQGDNLLLTKNPNVRQIPEILQDEEALPHPSVPLVTRIFRVKYAKPDTIATILRPMMSSSALIEISAETRQLVITDVLTNVEKIASLLPLLDIDIPHTSFEIESYVSAYVPLKELIKLVTEILKPVADGTPMIFVPYVETNTIYIISTPYLIDRAIALFEDLDKPAIPPLEKPHMLSENILVYKILHRTPDALIHDMHEIASQIVTISGQTPKLVVTLNGVKWIENADSLVFIGDEETLAKVKEILSSLDVASAQVATVALKTGFFLYKVQNATIEQMQESIAQMIQDLQESGIPEVELIDTLKSMRWIRDAHALLFVGVESSLKEIGKILPTFDITPPHARATVALPSTNFLIYTPVYRPAADLAEAVRSITEKLIHAGLADASFIHSLESIRIETETQSLVFTGDPHSLERLHVLLQVIDKAVTSTPPMPREIFLYKPKYVGKEQVEAGMHEIAHSLNAAAPADAKLITAIESMRWIPESNSFLFKAEPSTITRVKTMLANIDIPQEVIKTAMRSFFFYRLQNVTGELILNNLKAMALSLSSAGITNNSLIDTLQTAKWIPENNTLLLTGTPADIDEAKAIIAQFDIPSLSTVPPPAVTSFYLYKPLHRAVEDLDTNLRTIAQDLGLSGFVDVELIRTIETMHYIATSNLILFTGTPASLEKIKELLTRIDTPLPKVPIIQQIGKTTFLIYKLKHVTAKQMMATLKSFADDLERSKVSDAELIQAIDSMRWIPETNSMLFTGTDLALQQIEGITDKFDIPPIVPPHVAVTSPIAPPIFALYTPKYVPGDLLISFLHDFKHNLESTDLYEPELFHVIDELKWLARTNTIIISGAPEAVTKTQELLTQFDIPSLAPPPPPPSPALPHLPAPPMLPLPPHITMPPPEIITPPPPPMVSAGFLVYKLHYHFGEEIQKALKEIAEALKAPESSKELADAIHSLQWIKQTNSLLGTGMPEVLTRLKELIASLDVPLRQVFIEVLVIETDVNNTQSFGLQWGSQFQWLKKSTIGVGNFPTTTSPSAPLPSSFPGTLQGINATTTPTGGDVPFTSGFDLGVIGDLIMHKGKSFLSLGSLVAALQVDTDNTIVINQKVIAQDSVPSSIFVGQNVPYTGSLVTNQTGTASVLTSANIEYRDVGVKLHITPRIGTDDIVTLEIDQEISQVIPTSVTSSAVQLAGIQTSRTTMKTRVHVPNKHFVVLSGQIHDHKVHVRSGIPCLGGLPVIGAVFSQNNRQDSKSNLIMFCRPHLLTNAQEYKEVTSHQEESYKQQTVLPHLKEEFDAGVDIVKTPDNE